MDKRKFERFEIELPARMETNSLNKKRVFDLVTKNISATGVYLSTNSPFSDGLHIKISLTTQNNKLVELTGSQSLIECEGNVVRSTQTGVAICFNKECQIVCLKSL